MVSTAQLPAKPASPVTHRPSERPSKPTPLLWLPIPLLLAALIVIVTISQANRARLAFEPAWVVFVLNAVVFVGASIVAAWLAARAFLAGGPNSILSLGCGVLCFGLACLVGSMMLSMGHMDAGIAVHNVAAMAAGLFHLVGALVVLSPRAAKPCPLPKRAGRVAVLYSLVLAVVGLALLATQLDWLPEFIHPDGRTTVLRSLVLGLTVAEYAAAALVLAFMDSRAGHFLRWYWAGLGLIAVGLASVAFSVVPGGPLSWLGRVAQALGQVYVLVCLVTIIRRSRGSHAPASWRIGVSFHRLERTLRETREQYKLLFDTSVDGVVLHELVSETAKGYFIEANEAVCSMLGYTAEEMRSLTPLDVMESDDRPGVSDDVEVLHREGVLIHRKTLVGKDGRRVPVEISTRLFEHDGKRMVMSMIRDIADRKRAEDALAAKEERMKVVEATRAERQRLFDVLQTLPAYVVLLSADYRVPFANRFFRERFGESHGRRCYEYLFGRSEPCEACETYKVLKTGEQQRWEWTGPDGRHYDVHDFPFTDTDGSSLIMEMGIDVTERKRAEAELRRQREHLEELVQQRTAELEQRNAQLGEEVEDRKRAEEALRESERLYRAIGESIDYGIWVCDPQGRNTYASESFLKLVGMTQAQCSGMGWGDVLHPDDVEATIAAWKQCVRSGGPWYREHRYRGTDGQWHPILACGVPMRNDRGEVTGWAGINLDISRLKQTEQERRQSEERYRTLFSAMTEGFAIHEIITDESGEPVDYRFLDINPAFERLTGLTRERVVGRTHSEVLPEDDPVWVQRYGEVALGGEPVEFDSYSPVLKRHYEVYAYRPAPRKFAVIFRDVTERKRGEESLRRAAEELTRSNQELEQFAYVASHDLQEPLRMVTGFMGRIRDRYADVLDDKGKEFIGYAVDGAQRMSALIKDLLAYSRVQRSELEKTEVDARSCFAMATANCRASIAASGAEVTCGELPKVRANKTQLTQLLQNLVGNAVKFRRSNVRPTVEVSATRQGAEWVFSVKDNGIGIPPEQQERVFQIFQRLHTRDKYPGTGIGLAICRKIVERHGGRIWVESTVGEGSEFHFTLRA